MAGVPYLRGCLDQLERDDGFPVLDEAFQTAVDGLYVPGFSATKAFGPFFGFLKGRSGGRDAARARPAQALAAAVGCGACGSRMRDATAGGAVVPASS